MIIFTLYKIYINPLGPKNFVAVKTPALSFFALIQWSNRIQTFAESVASALLFPSYCEIMCDLHMEL